MPLLVCGAEGEWALYNNTLHANGTDTKRRGSVEIVEGEQMFKAFSATTDCWAHVRFAGEGSNANGSQPRDFIQVRDTNGNVMAAIRDDGREFDSSWGVNVRYATSTGGGLATGAEAFPLTDLEFQDWDIRVQITTATNPDDTMTVSFYRNGQLRFTTSVVDASGWAHPAQILLRERNGQLNTNMDHAYYQDVIVSDGIPTVGMELAVLVPSAVGNYSDFANDYNNIDDDGYDSSTVISTSTPTDRESWVFSSPTFDLGDKVIYAVVMDTVAQLDLGAAIADFQPFLRISATDYAGASLGANNIVPDSYITIFTQNPATSNPWQEADLTGLEAGILAQ